MLQPAQHSLRPELYPEVLDTLGCSTMQYGGRDLGQLEEAGDLLRRSYNASLRQFGLHHPSTRTYKRNLDSLERAESATTPCAAAPRRREAVCKISGLRTEHPFILMFEA